jgi:hypothetical protein
VHEPVVHEEPNNVNARLALSELYKETGNYDAAIAIVSHTSVPLGTSLYPPLLSTRDVTPPTLTTPFRCAAQRQQYEDDSHMDTEGDGESSAMMPPDGELSEQDQVWLDAEHVKMTVQKGLLYFHLEQHKEFLDTGTCVSCVLSLTGLTHMAHTTHTSPTACVGILSERPQHYQSVYEVAEEEDDHGRQTPQATKACQASSGTGSAAGGRSQWR